MLTALALEVQPTNRRQKIGVANLNCSSIDKANNSLQLEL